MTELLGSIGGSFNMSETVSNTVFYIKIIFWIIVVIGLIFFIKRLLDYKHKVFVFERRANNIIKVYVDRAREIKENKTVCLKLMKLKYLVPRLEGQKYTFTAGKKDIYFYEKLDDDHIVPITRIADPDPHFKPIDQDMKFWLFEQWRKTDEIYKNNDFIQKYGTVIMTVGGAILIFVLMLILIDKIGDVSDSLSNVANAMANLKIEPIIR